MGRHIVIDLRKVDNKVADLAAEKNQMRPATNIIKSKSANEIESTSGSFYSGKIGTRAVKQC